MAEESKQQPAQDAPTPADTAPDDLDYTLSSTLRPIKSIYDDFSLTSGSASGVRFRNHNLTREFKIYDQPNAQLILEEVDDRGEGDEEQDRRRTKGIRIKQANDSSYGLQFLR